MTRRNGRVNYASSHLGSLELYSMRLHSGDMAHIGDTAPVICRGFLFVEVRPAAVPARRHPL
jgi:hypothetical protein